MYGQGLIESKVSSAWAWSATMPGFGPWIVVYEEDRACRCFD